MNSQNDFINYFKNVPKTGVIYVLEKAYQNGYSHHDKRWANLGQGAPETGPLNGENLDVSINIDSDNSEYAPVCGKMELREQIAAYYNQVFRRNRESKYSYKNVCVAGGGRMALSRLVSALGNINLGHFIPDYTAYEELLSIFHNFVPIPISLQKDSNYKISVSNLKEEIVSKGLSAV